MLKTIECLFSDIDNAKQTIKEINIRNINCISINLSNKTINEYKNVSAPKGTYGSVSQNILSEQGYSDNATTTFPGIILATSPYTGLNNDFDSQGIDFITDFKNSKEFFSLKITTKAKNMPTLKAVFKKYGGKNIAVIR